MKNIMQEWFYRPIPPFDDFFEKIEKALGFKLFIWQKTFIIDGCFRQYGETTAKIIRLLTVDDIPIDLTQRPKTARENFENDELVKIYEKLRAAGVPTCPVFLTKKDRENMQRRTGKGMFYLYPGYDTGEKVRDKYGNNTKRNDNSTSLE